MELLSSGPNAEPGQAARRHSHCQGPCRAGETLCCSRKCTFLLPVPSQPGWVLRERPGWALDLIRHRLQVLVLTLNFQCQHRWKPRIGIKYSDVEGGPGVAFLGSNLGLVTHCRMILGQWFPTGGDFAPQETSAISGDICGCHK